MPGTAVKNNKRISCYLISVLNDPIRLLELDLLNEVCHFLPGDIGGRKVIKNGDSC